MKCSYLDIFADALRCTASQNEYPYQLYPSLRHNLSMCFYAANEINVTMNSGSRKYVDASMTNNNHIGLLIPTSPAKWDRLTGAPPCYVIFLSCRHGMNWNPSLMKSTAPVICSQLSVITDSDILSVKGRSFDSLLLVHDKKEFKLAVTDEHKMRQSSHIPLGQNSASLHILPLNVDGIRLSADICFTDDYDAHILTLADKHHHIEMDPVTSPNFPYLFNGKRCTANFSFDAAKIYHCLDREQKVGSGSSGTICWM